MKLFILLFILLVVLISLLCFIKRKREYFSYNEEDQLNEEDMITLLTYIAKYLRPDIEKEIIISAGIKSETLHKKHIKLCLYDENKKMYALPTLIYVLIHEMTHVITETISGYGGKPHDELFHSNLSMLLDQAKKKGIYVSLNNVPETYCKRKKKSV
uniref:WLM domain-containing protein n=1 Tax=viral metagenome TaxID=1070528 RepID=A0A6C0J8V6_9ZZZZ